MAEEIKAVAEAKPVEEKTQAEELEMQGEIVEEEKEKPCTRNKKSGGSSLLSRERSV
jgi:hypothetical protein